MSSVSDLERLRDEHARADIGPDLLDLLDRIVRATAPSYPAREYSDAGVWNREALEDARQDWFTTRLLGRGDLTVMLKSAATVGSLRGMLTRSFGQFLTNRRRRTSATNLFQRTVKALRADSKFSSVGSSRTVGDQLWTLTAGSSSELTTVTLEELVKAAWELDDDALQVVRYGPYSLKSSPILREPSLVHFLEHLLQCAGGATATADLFHVMRHRFNLIALPPAELDEGIVASDIAPPAQVEQSEIARSVLSRLDIPRTAVLREFEHNDGDLRVTARALGLPIHSVTSAVDEVMAMISEYADTADDAAAVYTRLIESLFLQSEDR